MTTYATYKSPNITTPWLTAIGECPVVHNALPSKWISIEDVADLLNVDIETLEFWNKTRRLRYDTRNGTKVYERQTINMILTPLK